VEAEVSRNIRLMLIAVLVAATAAVVAGCGGGDNNTDTSGGAKATLAVGSVGNDPGAGHPEVPKVISAWEKWTNANGGVV